MKNVITYLYICIMSLLILSYSCTERISNKVRIFGNVLNVPTTKIFLTEAHDWKIFIDSANVKDGKFELFFNQQDQKIFMASLCYYDTAGHIKKLNYKNHILSPDKTKYVIDAFLIGKSDIEINGDILSKEYFTINRYSQNDAFYAAQMFSFGYLNTGNDSIKNNQINTYRQLIEQYPDSYYYLSGITEFKGFYNKAELKYLLQPFSENIKATNNWKSLYKEADQNVSKFVSNYLVYNSHLVKSPIIDSSASLNMLIFWASWCGPCLNEIPELKKIYTKYKNTNLHIVSISLDEDEIKWRNSLQTMGMPWEQLILDKISKDKIQEEISFSSIPFILFTDNKGYEKARFLGYDSSHFKLFSEIIEKNVEKRPSIVTEETTGLSTQQSTQ